MLCFSDLLTSTLLNPRQQAEWSLVNEGQQEMATLWPLSTCTAMLSSEATPPPLTRKSENSSE